MLEGLIAAAVVTVVGVLATWGWIWIEDWRERKREVEYDYEPIEVDILDSEGNLIDTIILTNEEWGVILQASVAMDMPVEDAMRQMISDYLDSLEEEVD